LLLLVLLVVVVVLLLLCRRRRVRQRIKSRCIYIQIAGLKNGCTVVSGFCAYDRHTLDLSAFR
jgi:hypothetical protein